MRKWFWVKKVEEGVFLTCGSIQLVNGFKVFASNHCGNQSIRFIEIMLRYTIQSQATQLVAFEIPWLMAWMKTVRFTDFSEEKSFSFEAVFLPHFPSTWNVFELLEADLLPLSWFVFECISISSKIESRWWQKNAATLFIFVRQYL